MKTFGLISDLHLDFGSEQHIKLPETDVLLIAGDVIEAKPLQEKYTDSHSRGLRKSFHRLGKRIEDMEYKTVLAIAGNHEFYGCHIDETHEILKEAWSDHGVVYLNSECVRYDDFEIWGGTYWTDFAGGMGPFMRHAQDNMMDYAHIKSGDELITPYEILQIHQDHKASLEQFLGSSSTLPKIVMTHHGPSKKSIDPLFQHDFMGNPAYVSEHDHLVEKANLWVHGHVHQVQYYNIGKCRVMCNPFGYLGYETRTGKMHNGLWWSLEEI
jgi:predicted phosphodiesterase